MTSFGHGEGLPKTIGKSLRPISIGHAEVEMYLQVDHAA
jgi:hypothetical protein